MPLTVEALKSRMEELRQQAAHLEHGIAQQEPKLRGLTDEQILRNPETREAKRWLFHNKPEAEMLRHRAQRLERMVLAPTRIEQAQEAVETTRALVDSARATDEAARKALETIESMIKAEQAAFEVARTAAASSLLATIKAGQDASTVETPNLDKVATLELAREEARAEREAAAAALKAATTSHAAAARGLELAKTGATQLAVEIANEAIVEAVIAHVAQCSRAGVNGFEDGTNLQQLISDRLAGAVPAGAARF